MKLDIEDYHGNTICTLELHDFNLADVENDTYRIQAENMKQNDNVFLIKNALKKALMELKQL